MKRLFVLLLTVAMLLSVLSVPAMAEAETIQQDAFVFERLSNGNLKLTDYTDKANQGTINIPSSVNGFQVERIGEYAFKDCKAANVTIPDSVKMIEAFAFDNCVGIQKITIPNNVFYIGGNPFTGCTSLVNISLDPNHPTLQVTSDGALYSMRNKMLLCYPCSKQDEEFTVKDGTLVIGKGAFRTCAKLKTVKLPETVTEIYGEAFMDCTGLNEIGLPASLLKIGELAFSGCSSLEKVTIPAKVSRIEKGTFSDCTKLTSVTLPGDITDIFDEAFSGCEALPEIRLPKNLSTIGEEAFAGCKNLTSVYVPVSVTQIGDRAFENCSVSLYLHMEKYAFAEIYARINDISFSYDTNDDFLNDAPEAETVTETVTEGIGG